MVVEGCLLIVWKTFKVVVLNGTFSWFFLYQQKWIKIKSSTNGARTIVKLALFFLRKKKSNKAYFGERDKSLRLPFLSHIKYLYYLTRLWLSVHFLELLLLSIKKKRNTTIVELSPHLQTLYGWDWRNWFRSSALDSVRWWYVSKSEYVLPSQRM